MYSNRSAICWFNVVQQQMIVFYSIEKGYILVLLCFVRVCLCVFCFLIFLLPLTFGPNVVPYIIADSKENTWRSFAYTVYLSRHKSQLSTSKVIWTHDRCPCATVFTIWNRVFHSKIDWIKIGAITTNKI